MKDKVRLIASGLAGVAALGAAPGAALEASAGVVAPVADEKEAVPLEEVPAAAKKAALDTVPGFVLERAFRESENGRVVYELEGTADGKKVEVEVTPEGEVLEVERGGAAGV